MIRGKTAQHTPTHVWFVPQPADKVPYVRAPRFSPHNKRTKRRKLAAKKKKSTCVPLADNNPGCSEAHLLTVSVPFPPKSKPSGMAITTVRRRGVQGTWNEPLRTSKHVVSPNVGRVLLANAVLSPMFQ